MGNRRTSLRTFLVIPAVVFFLLATGVSWYQRDAAADGARKEAIADARFGARVAARELDSGIRQITEDVAATAATPGIESVFAAAEGCTLNFSSSAPFAAGHLDIVAADGSVVCSSRAANRDVSYAGDAWLRDALAGPIVRSFVRDRRTGKQSVAIASPIGDLGVLVTFVEQESIARGLASSFGGPHNRAFVVEAAEGHRTVSRSTNDGIEASTHYSGDADVAATGWRVVAGIDKDAALRSAFSVSNRQFLAVAMALPIALLMVLYLYRGTARPIANLSAGVRQATEDLSAPPVNVAGPREISQLVDDFNGLIATARRERELEEKLRRAERVDEQERELRLLADRDASGAICTTP